MADAREEIDVVILGQDERCGHLEVTVEVIDEGCLGGWTIIRSQRESLRLLLSNPVVPETDSFLDILATLSEGLSHETVVVGRQVNR